MTGVGGLANAGLRSLKAAGVSCVTISLRAHASSWASLREHALSFVQITTHTNSAITNFKTRLSVEDG